MPQTLTPYDWFASILRGESPQYASLDGRVSEKALWRTGLENGALVLANHKLANSAALHSLPASFREKLNKHSLNAAAAELGQTHELLEAISLFNQARIPFLLIKGAPLAYTHYSHPYLRSRCDTDILFESNKDAEKAFAQLKPRGYQRPNAVSGKFISHEFSCYQKNKAGTTNTLDMHWRLNNAHRFAHVLNFSEMADLSMQVTDLDEKIHALAPPHALLLACMHRIAHKIERMENRLIWLYDIHLLTTKFSVEQWNEFIDLVTEKGMCGICLDGLQQTIKILGTNIAEERLKTLEEGKNREKHGVEMGDSRLSMEISNLRALPNWQARLGLIKERVFPDANYMMMKYNTRHRLLLPYFYLKRAVGGISKTLLRKS